MKQTKATVMAQCAVQEPAPAAVTLIVREVAHQALEDVADLARTFHSSLLSRFSEPPLTAPARIWGEMSAPLWQALQTHIRNPLLRLKWIEDHEAMHAMLAARDRRRARSAMKAHVKRVR